MMPVAYLRSLVFLVANLTSFCAVLWRLPPQTYTFKWAKTIRDSNQCYLHAQTTSPWVARAKATRSLPDLGATWNASDPRSEVYWRVTSRYCSCIDQLINLAASQRTLDNPDFFEFDEGSQCLHKINLCRVNGLLINKIYTFIGNVTLLLMYRSTD